MVDVIGAEIFDIGNGAMECIEGFDVAWECCPLHCQESWGAVDGAEEGDTSTGLV